MPRSSPAIAVMPEAVMSSLVLFGAHLRTARQRRDESLRTMAARIGTSIPTLRRMEAGDPKVAIGVYATALWIFGKASTLGDILEPASDEYATMLDVDRADRRRARR
ncbi:helix-turn-helix transcriptional regulator [Aureimonas sp. Leaf324]|uniref:helix-turn-helix domain-containing protein n=1 Tax=Aureimonas sp. Leaf324 TaxID=1736336 RepID=UPI0006F640E5|nr:helix-turn-helix transcriptional regulator [Aureimonas sp. Leaf324]KQQ85682.1 hypothetical protein ASF65_03800 [Aureimonas sp. Leaf324]